MNEHLTAGSGRAYRFVGYLVVVLVRQLSSQFRYAPLARVVAVEIAAKLWTIFSFQRTRAVIRHLVDGEVNLRS